MSPDLNPTPVTVTRHAARERYEIMTVEAPESFIGFLGYRMLGEHLVELQHTIIAEEFARQGFARTLVTHVLDDIRTRGLRIVPTCTYVRSYLDRFPEYADLVADA